MSPFLKKLQFHKSLQAWKQVQRKVLIEKKLPWRSKAADLNSDLYLIYAANHT
jgi:hypothetical protein